MEGETVYSIWSSLDPDAKVAFLQRETIQQDVFLPDDAARYFATNFRSETRGLREALNRLITYSKRAGTPITLDVTKRILWKHFESQGPKSTVDPFEAIFSPQREKQQATSPRERSTDVDSSVIFSLMKTHEAQEITRTRHKFEVNMREFERERLARLDKYERALEIRVKKQRRR